MVLKNPMEFRSPKTSADRSIVSTSKSSMAVTMLLARHIRAPAIDRVAVRDVTSKIETLPYQGSERSTRPSSAHASNTQLKVILKGASLKLQDSRKIPPVEGQLSSRNRKHQICEGRNGENGENGNSGKHTACNRRDASQKTKGPISKDKDPKSITQNIFNTASMTLLQFAKLPQIWLSSGNAQDRHAEVTDPEWFIQCDGEEYACYSSDIRGFGSENLKPTSLASDQPSTSSPTANNEHVVEKDLPVASELGVEVHKRDDPLGRDPTQAQYNILWAHCVICESQTETGDPFLFCVPKRLVDERCLPLDPGTRLQLTRQSNPSHLLASAAGTRQEMLAQLGRTDNHLPLLECKREHQGSHAQVHPMYMHSVTYPLSSFSILLRCYVSHKSYGNKSMVVWSDEFSDMVEGFKLLHKRDYHPSSVFSCLWQSASSLYVSMPSRFKGTKPEELFPGYLSTTSPAKEMDALSHTGAAHITKQIFAALVASIELKDQNVWLAVQRLRKSGHIALPEMPEPTADVRKTIAETLTILDSFEDDMAHLLLRRLAKAVATRIHLPDSRIFPAQQNVKEDSGATLDIITLIVRGLTVAKAIMVVQEDVNHRPTLKHGTSIGHTVQSTTIGQQIDNNAKIYLEVVVEWLRGILLKEWDGNPEVPKCSAVGGALELLGSLYKYYGGRHLSLEIFQTTYVSERLHVLDMPTKYMEFALHDSHVHILGYSFLFPPSTLVSYFRAINHATMSKASEEAMANSSLAMRMTFANCNSGGRGRLRLEDRLGKLTDYYLTLNIRREDVLTDAMSQLWRRQKRELIRPLKIRLGRDEGEEGVDHGGVQQEFFRIAIAEALDPKYGAFTTDPVTRMSWFQVRSLEPLYKFELLGILVSLAVYNGVTLPFTFPLALYMKLLHHEPDDIEDITDGWPELAKGLKTLRDWKEGDVEHVFVRDYVFSVDVFGQTLHVDMSEQSCRRRENQQGISEKSRVNSDFRLPSDESSPSTCSSNTYGELSTSGNSQAQPTLSSSTPSSSGASSAPPPVTNANRDQYIRDYIHHLTNISIQDQFRAFARGFTSCISPRSLALFTPRTLKELVEGVPHVDTYQLEAITRYEGGYHGEHRAIRDFWNIVHSWALNDGEAGQKKLRQLLEFVTASDRLPVGGMTRVIFMIQKNGVGDERLPTSLTCFGRLLLPEFSSPKVLAKMLSKALENSKGFGQP
ncbi:MAG: hypothetical protein Q9163_000777 [Psora crenata]